MSYGGSNCQGGDLIDLVNTLLNGGTNPQTSIGTNPNYIPRNPYQYNPYSPFQDVRNEADDIRGSLAEARNISISSYDPTDPSTWGPGVPENYEALAIEGLRHRLFLKFIGIDFEFFNPRDQVYRG